MDLLESLSANIGEMITGPGADAALLYYSTHAVHNILSGVFWIILMVIAAWAFAKYAWPRAKDFKVEDGMELFLVTVVGVVGFLVVLLMLDGAFDLVDPRNWVQIFHPEIGMVRDAVAALKAS